MTSGYADTAQRIGRSDLREGLPPCIQFAVFEDRFVCRTNYDKCPDDTHKSVTGYQWYVVAGLESVTRFPLPHTELLWKGGRGPMIVECNTDDEDEAEAAWVKAEHFVKTGELP